MTRWGSEAQHRIAKRFGVIATTVALIALAFVALPARATDNVHEFSIDDVTQDEGTGGSTTFTFTVSVTPTVPPTVLPMMVDWATADNTARASGDYTAVPATTLTFNPGENSKTVSVTVVADAAVEPDETFFVNLSNPENADIADGQGVGTIDNDDGTPVPSLSINDVTVNEGNAGTTLATFTVTLSPVSTQTVTVQWATADGTATQPGDYAPGSGTLTFAPADPSETLTVTINGDTKNEDAETFFVNLSNPSNASIGDAQGTGSILNDDLSPPSLSINDATQPESSGTFYFTVTLSTASGRTVTVDYGTQNGTAMAGSDFTATSDQLTFLEGETSKTITVPVTADSTNEANETFTVNLTNPSFATIADGTGVGTITNDDNPPTVSIADQAVTEGNSGTVTETFTVTLSAASGQTVTVQYATSDDTATQPGDYTAASGTVTFAPGDTTETVDVLVKGDTIDEVNETYFVDLSAPTNATIGDGHAVGTINDNDGLPELSIGDATAGEGAGTATFTVTLAPASGQTVTVQYSTVAGTATANSDYTPVNGTLTFVPGDTTETITVPILQDQIDEPDETYIVRLATPTNAAIGDADGAGTITDDDAIPAVSVNDVTQAEGTSPILPTTFTFTVTLSNASTQSVSVNYATADDTATTANMDYEPASGSLTFTPGQTSRTFNVEVTGDSDPELNETFFVNLSSPSNASLGDPQGVGTITNDDGPPALISINDVTVAEGDAGTSNATFTVSLASPNTDPVTVHYSTADGTAAQPGDYTQVPDTTLTFAPGETSKPVNVPVVGDTVDEANETFTVNLSDPSANAVITDPQGVGTITDDDAAPTLAIGDAMVTEGNSGPTTATFTVTKTGSTAQTVTVHYSTADGTATAPGDYTAVPDTTLTFAPGETTKTIDVAVQGDTTDEVDETFTVDLTSPTNATITDAQGVGTITDDDEVPALSITDDTQSEGDASTTDASFTVSLSAVSAKTVTVHYATADGTATAPADYTAVPDTTLTFAPGEMVKVVTVPVAGDTIDEADETFTVNLSNATNATIADAQGVGTITDDDASPELSIDDDTVAEGDSGTTNATFTVTLSEASEQTVTVHHATADGTATAPADYTATSGDLTFVPGETTKTVDVPVVGDTVDEADETFSVVLSVPTNATIADGTGTGTGTGTITDDDAGSALSINDAAVAEGNSGTTNATFTVTLSAPSGQAVTVHYATADGTATEPDDYTATSGDLTFAPGETTKTFAVAVKGDTVDEVDEAFTAELSAPTNATIADGTGVGTITDEDAGPALSINDVTMAEGNSGTTNATFTVTKSGSTAQTVTVHYQTSNGTATGPSDYTATSGDLSFAPGETTKTVDVPVVGDTTNEADEAFTVTLSTPANATIADGQGTGTIVNDDATLSVNDVTVTEGNSGTTNATFTVTLSSASGQTVTVHYATSNGTATEPGDYTATSGDLSFAPGDTTKTVDVPVLGDTVDEADETFSVVLSAPTNATIADGTGAGTITDDDGPGTLSVNDVTVTEGNSGTTNATFTVTLSSASGQTVTVHYATSNGTATEPGDYAATSGDLSFAPGDTTKTFAVPVNGDTTSEATETFTVTLSAPTNATVSDGTGTGTITNDDASPQITTGAGQGGGPHVANFTGSGGPLGGFFAYENNFPGGVRVARGDFDLDGSDEIVTASGPGRAPTVRVWTAGGTLLASFNAYGTFQGGVFVAVADVTGDSRPEIITGAGAGGGPHVRVFDNVGGDLGGWFAYDPAFSGGVSVAAGDVVTGGKAEVVTGPGAGGGPHVKAFSGAGAVFASFFAYDPAFTGGVFVAAGGDRIVTGPGPGGGPHVKAFNSAGAVFASFFAYEPGFTGGVRVAVGDVDGGGPEIVTAPGPGGGPHVRAFTLDGSGLGGGFFAYSPVFTGGVFPAVGRA